MENKKIIAGFELVLMVVSVFAFAHFVYLSGGVFGEVDDVEDGGGGFLSFIWERLKAPMISIVSAESFGLGCCAVAESGEKCATTTLDICDTPDEFAEGALCGATSFCRKGCCFSEELGVFDKSTTKSECDLGEWSGDEFCNIPGARKGCCFLGDVNYFETRRQCEIDTENRALGDSAVVDWKFGVSEGECVASAVIQKEGACVLGGRNCEFGTEAECLSYNGAFSEGLLCTSPVLNTSCVRTKETSCVEGRDGVYFLDSCGNRGNIYDSSRVDDATYWDGVIKEGLCGENNVEGGNANSEDCGNCNRFAGGICRSAEEDDFDVDSGSYYCKDTSCMVGGVKYKNGESWCVYDGAIGNGDDVVGSRHWKYVCNYGVATVEPCADYRNQICVQSNTFDVDGKQIEFRNAACVANNWRTCINLNSEAGGMAKCQDTLNCRVEEVRIADAFYFDVCTPKYPGGFSFRDPRYQKTATATCALASQSCMVVYEPKMFGGCKLEANKGCLSKMFAEEMNDLCRGLGDCGGAVNINGKYVGSYGALNTGGHKDTTKAPAKMLDGDAIQELVDMATPVPGQIAEVEDYTEFLKAAGFFGGPGPAPEGEEYEGPGEDLMIGAAGIAGIGYAVGSIITVGTFGFGSAAYLSSSALGLGFTAGTPLVGAFAGAAIGAAAGMVSGVIIAKQMGLSPLGTIFMGIGGAMVAGSLVFAYIWFDAGIVACFDPSLCLAVLLIGLVLVIVGAFLGGDDCDPIRVQFDCIPWQPPRGGDDCESCNEDSLKPCSEYRCHSLGAACELLNKGSDNELCVASRDDGKPPVLSPQIGTMSANAKYVPGDDSGFEIASLDGGCIDAYTKLLFGVVSDKPAHCKFDLELNEFDEMAYNLGGNYLTRNHTMVFPLPDPSGGESRGLNWSGELSLYVKCQDAYEHESRGFYKIDMCVNQGPDKMAPLIDAYSPADDTMVGFNVSSRDVEIYVNENNVSCRWDAEDKDYDLMGNDWSCGTNPSGVYGSFSRCNATLPVGVGDSEFYIRCKDQGWLEGVGRGDERNPNVESFVYRLRKPVKKIAIDWIEPDADFEVSTPTATADFKIATSGGGDWHHCSYSFDGYDNMVDNLFQTGAERPHSWAMNWPAGDHNIFVECVDETGDSARAMTSFKIVRDSSAPQVARVWQSSGVLHLITNEKAECRYATTSCRYNWEDGEMAGNGKEHTIDVVRGDSYYIKCEDEFGNVPSECSIEVRAL